MRQGMFFDNFLLRKYVNHLLCIDDGLSMSVSHFFIFRLTSFGTNAREEEKPAIDICLVMRIHSVKLSLNGPR
jgi:hypothetical protein